MLSDKRVTQLHLESDHLDKSISHGVRILVVDE